MDVFGSEDILLSVCFECRQVKLEFTAPETPGDYNLVLYLMSDSYLGSDQEFEFSISVIPSDEDN